MEKLITRKEAAEILGISIATLDAPIVQSQWKKALHTASCEVSELELFRILAGT